MSDMAIEVWDAFDAEVSQATATNPWINGSFNADLHLLASLLEIPLRRASASQSGLRAKAVDVWIAAELRRAGFDRDEVWPRPRAPRVVPRDVARLLRTLPRAESERLAARLDKYPSGVVGADARVLGRAYYKQVDVAISHWATGPELLISTKRMDSSMSNNALNRIEESYGDSHNLRGRHPLAAIGYALLTSTHAIEGAGTTPTRLFDLVGRLAQEEGGYDASTVIVAQWDEAIPAAERVVTVRTDLTSDGLGPNRFFETVIGAVLDRTPIADHQRARALRDGTTPA